MKESNVESRAEVSLGAGAHRGDLPPTDEVREINCGLAGHSIDHGLGVLLALPTDRRLVVINRALPSPTVGVDSGVDLPTARPDELPQVG